MTKAAQDVLAEKYELFCPANAEIRKAVYPGTLCKTCTYFRYDCRQVTKQTEIISGYECVTDCALYEIEDRQ